MEFSPFNSNILAFSNFSNDNSSVMISSLREEKNGFNFTQMKYREHTKKVNFVNFNPVASNVMCSCSGNGELHVWDYKFLKPIKEYSIKDYPNTISWSPNGATIGISEKSKLFHILDPRIGKIILERQISDIFAAQRFSWIDNSSIAIIGWDIQSNKVLNILDIRKADKFSSSILIDKSNYPSHPFINPELKLIYSVEKEDCYIKVFDYSQGTLEKCLEYRCSEPNIFSVSLNRRYLDKNKLEIDRLVRYTKNKNIYYVSFTYKDIQNLDFDKLYPNEEAGKPQLTSDQWISGQNAELINKKIYKRGPTDNNNKIQSENSFKKNEQNPTNNKKNVDINIIAGQGSYQIRYKNSNLRNEDPKKPYLPKPSIKVDNQEMNVNECTNCNEMKITIKNLEADNKALNNKINESIKEYKNLSENYYKILDDNKEKKSSINELNIINDNHKIELNRIKRQNGELLNSNRNINEEKILKKQEQIKELEKNLQDFESKYKAKKELFNKLLNKIINFMNIIKLIK